MQTLSQIYKKRDAVIPQGHVLLIGAPRSGTTLLASMIGRHTEAGILNEDVTGVGIFKIVGKQLTGNKLCVPNQIQLSGKRLFGARFLRKIGVLSEAPQSKYSIRDYLDLPNLKIIAILRDGNDTILSMMTRGRDKLEKAAQRWNQAVETIYELKRSHGPRTLVITFEDLVLKPREAMLTVCQFLDLKFEERMLDGPRYNSKYPEPHLKIEKVYRHKQEKVNFQLQQLTPTGYRKYRDLVALDRQQDSPPENA